METRKVLGVVVRGTLLFLLILCANLLAFYITAGVALRGDWDRIDTAITKAYNELLDN